MVVVRMALKTAEPVSHHVNMITHPCIFPILADKQLFKWLFGLDLYIYLQIYYFLVLDSQQGKLLFVCHSKDYCLNYVLNVFEGVIHCSCLQYLKYVVPTNESNMEIYFCFT